MKGEKTPVTTPRVSVLVVEPSPLLGPRLEPLFVRRLERVSGPVTAAGMLSAVRSFEPNVVLVRVDGPSSELTRAVEHVMAERPVPMLLLATGAGPRQAAMALLRRTRGDAAARALLDKALLDVKDRATADELEKLRR